MTRTGLIVGWVLALGAVLPCSAEIYKWTDEQGNVHYGERPPAREPAREIQVEAGPAPEEIDRARKDLDRRLEDQRWEREKDQQAQDRQRRLEQEEQRKAAYRKRQCTTARDNLQALREQRPVYELDRQGERVYLDDAERQARIERTRRDVEKYCD